VRRSELSREVLKARVLRLSCRTVPGTAMKWGQLDAIHIGIDTSLKASHLGAHLFQYPR